MSAPTDDQALRDLWQGAGGTIFHAGRETASMPTAKLLPMLRTLGTPEALAAVLAPAPAPTAPTALQRRAADMTDAELGAFLDWRNAGRPPARAAAAPVVAGPPAIDPSNSVLAQYGAALDALIRAVLPELPPGNLLEDARKAAAAMAPAALAGYFVVDDETEPGSPRIAQVQEQFKDDPDVFRLYRRAPRVAELALDVPAREEYAAPAAAEREAGPAAAPRRAARKGARA